MPGTSPHCRPTIASRPSPRDKPALIYLFTERNGTIAKIGRTNDTERCRKEWARKCDPEPQTWVCCWPVPYGVKFEEALVHAHYKDASAWIRPKPCASRRCRVKHREKFCFAACGGFDRVERVVDDLLGKLGGERVWVILPAYPPRSAHLALKRTQALDDGKQPSSAPTSTTSFQCQLHVVRAEARTSMHLYKTLSSTSERYPRPPSAILDLRALSSTSERRLCAKKKPSASPTTPNHPSTPSGTTGTSPECRMTCSRPKSVRESRYQPVPSSLSRSVSEPLADLRSEPRAYPRLTLGSPAGSARRGTSRSSFHAGKNIFFGRRKKRNEKGAFWHGFSAGTKQAFVSIKKTRQKATF
ncbi:hypothetical protein C8F01DRAFT_1090155 [Mycena amicta]|nr:hypothetical protein C8F01DRAFT_1090155 [Mycena amicta]